VNGREKLSIREQVSIKEMNESESTDEVTKSLKLSGKSTLSEGSVKSTADTCLPAVCRPLFRRHDFDAGFKRELERSCWRTCRTITNQRSILSEEERYKSERKGLKTVKPPGSRKKP
jgi:hypothetical protein